MKQFNKSVLPASKERRKVLLAGGALMASSSWAQSGTWNPSRPIKLVVTYPPGGGADVSARAMTDQLGQKLGQPVVIDNRAGAGGVVGTEVVYHAPADGHTLLWGNADILAIAPHLYAKLPYKPQEFIPISPVCGIGFVLAGRQGLEAKNFGELLSLARSKELTSASWGNGSPGHVGTEMFKTLGKIPKMLTVPYQGTAPAAQALLAGQVDLMFMPMPLWQSMQSRIGTYAVAAKARYPRMASVATMAEFGVPADLEVWQGLFAPPQTPRAAIEQIHRATRDVMADANVRKKLEELGALPLSGSQEEFASLISKDMIRWGEIMRSAGVQPQN